MMSSEATKPDNDFPFGTKVTFVHSKAGYPEDQEKAKYLTLGDEYTVVDQIKDNKNTWIYLKGFPGKHFNSVQFTKVQPQTGE